MKCSAKCGRDADLLRVIGGVAYPLCAKCYAWLIQAEHIVEEARKYVPRKRA